MGELQFNTPLTCDESTENSFHTLHYICGGTIAELDDHIYRGFVQIMGSIIAQQKTLNLYYAGTNKLRQLDLLKWQGARHGRPVWDHYINPVCPKYAIRNEFLGLAKEYGCASESHAFSIAIKMAHYIIDCQMDELDHIPMVTSNGLITPESEIDLLFDIVNINHRQGRMFVAIGDGGHRLIPLSTFATK